MSELDLEWTDFPDEAATLGARSRQWVLLPPSRPGAAMLPPISLFPPPLELTPLSADPDVETVRPPLRSE